MLHRWCSVVEGNVRIGVSPTNWSDERCSNPGVESVASSSVNLMLSKAVSEIDHHCWMDRCALQGVQRHSIKHGKNVKSPNALNRSQPMFTAMLLCVGGMCGLN